MEDDFDYYDYQDSILFGDGIDTDPDSTDRETRNIEAVLDAALYELEEMMSAVRKLMPDRPDLSDDQVVHCVQKWLDDIGGHDESKTDMALVLDAVPLLHVLRSGISVSKGFNFVGEHSLTIGPNIPSIPSLGIAGCGFDFDQNPFRVLQAAEDVNDLAQIMYIRERRGADKAFSPTADPEGNYIWMNRYEGEEEEPAVEEPAVEEPAGKNDHDEMLKMLAEEDIDKFFDYIFGPEPDEESSSDAEGEPQSE